MSAFEQRKEPLDKNVQYLLFAAEPYETIAFKIPNKEIERDTASGKFYYNWDRDKKIFTVTKKIINEIKFIFSFSYKSTLKKIKKK